MKKSITILFLLCLCFSIRLQSQTFEQASSGVTIIVHGWDPGGSQPAWMNAISNAIASRTGGTVKSGKITVSGTKGNLSATCDPWNFDLETESHNEIVVVIDWTAVANHIETGISAQEVAATVVPKIYQGQNGKPALAELPIHLIGHSRGGGMVFEIARLLGLQGIEVEQVTALDPHPLTTADMQGLPFPLGPGSTIDTPVEIYDNVLFADNYYQNIEYPTGQYVDGAYNRLWTNMPGGYHNETGYSFNILGTDYNFSDHLNIILMYYGTIDLQTPVNNGEATITQTERDAWFNDYENNGENTGFYHSRIITSNRKSEDTPISGGDAIREGYHNNTQLGGNGTRASIDMSNAVWPNVLTIDVLRNDTKLEYGKQYLTLDENLEIKYNYRSNTNASDVTFYVDQDKNPYNNNNLTTVNTTNQAATGAAISQLSTQWTITGLATGMAFYLYAKTDDGTHQRYLYAPYKFEIQEADLPKITTQPEDQTNVCLLDAVDFSVEGNNITSYQWQVSSDNGTEWSDIINNSVYSGANTNTLSVIVSDTDDETLYACIVSNENGDMKSNSAVLSVDNSKPVVTCISNQNVELQQGQTTYTVSGTEFDPTETSDNCDGTTISNDFNDAASLNGAQLPIGTSTITWTAEDLAGNKSVCSFDVTVVGYTGMETLNKKEISIYPNPTEGTIHLSSQNIDIRYLQISGIRGKTIFLDKTIEANETINLHGLKAGIYILKIQTTKQTFYSKIIKK